MTRPVLRAVPLADVLPPKPGTLYVTMGPGQWDALLESAYDDGCVLLEVEGQKPVRAYQRAKPVDRATASTT